MNSRIFRSSQPAPKMARCAKVFVGVEGNGQAPAAGNPEKPEVAGIGQQVKHRQECIYDDVGEEIAVEAAQMGHAMPSAPMGL